LAGQAGNLATRHSDVRADIYADAGHALFVDDSDRFNAELLDFMRTGIRQ
jgi:pimeloyl-ACP methyl ester carboxylesterase